MDFAYFRMEDTAVARVSDDFYPTDAASWTSHLGICAYNSLFMSPLIQVQTTPCTVCAAVVLHVVNKCILGRNQLCGKHFAAVYTVTQKDITPAFQVFAC